MTVHREQSVKSERERKKPRRCNNQMFIINFCLNMFRASLYPSSGEQRPCVTAYGVLLWFCWMWLVAVVGRCVVGCEQCSHPTTQRPTTATNHIQHKTVTFTVLTSYKTAPHNRYQPHPTHNSNLYSAHILQRSAPQPLPTTSSTEQ